MYIATRTACIMFRLKDYNDDGGNYMKNKKKLNHIKYNQKQMNLIKTID